MTGGPVRPHRLEEITHCLLSERGHLLSAAPAGAGGRAWLSRHTEVVDRALQALFALAAGEGGWTRPDEAPVALLATGGYGRRELAPYSDIDLAFVPVEEDEPAADALIKTAFRQAIEVLMDGARLEVGYAFRPVADLGALAHADRTALLDARLVAGNARIADRFRQALLARVDLSSLLQGAANDHARRRGDARRCLYSVEPDIKEGAGGLRELQSAVRLLQVRHRVEADDPLKGLAAAGVVAASTAAAVEEAREFIWRLRNWLHLTAQRKLDVLSIEHQARAAAELAAEETRPHSPAKFLDAYYRRAETIACFREQAVDALLEEELPVGEGFVARSGRLYAIAGVLEESRDGLLAAAAHAQRCGLDLSASLASEMAERALLIDERARHSPEAAASFLAVLGGDEAEFWLRRLRALGVLQRYLPELGATMRLAPADRSHAFTVGEHGLRVAGWLAGMIARPPAAPSLLGHALSQVADAEVLVLAGLLHDTGKLAEDQDHSLAGERIARSIGERLGLGRARVDTLGLLVREHLLLSLASRLRDHKDPATLAEVTERAGDRETLHTLYLLSQADLRNVSPGSSISVELHLLDELYERVLAASAGPPSPPDAVRGEIARRLDAAPQRAAQRLVERMPPRYLLNTPLIEIARHVALFDRLEREEPVIEITPAAGGELSEVVVCVHDDPEPGLLHKITGALYAHDLDIHSAHVFTTDEDRPVALDTLWVSRRRAPLGEAQAERLMRDLRSVLGGGGDVGELLAASGKSPASPLSLGLVRARNDASEEHTVVEVEATDVPGLLFRLTGALSEIGLDIHTAKITGWGGRAVDAFYVTRRGSAKPAADELGEIESALGASLSGGS